MFGIHEDLSESVLKIKKKLRVCGGNWTSFVKIGTKSIGCGGRKINIMPDLSVLSMEDLLQPRRKKVRRREIGFD